MDASKVETILVKAAAAEKADDALKFSQAALNVAHAINVLAQIQQRQAGT